ncbi:MAG: SufD family Fe-S cluster assembly protein [Candidatus Woesearchaeota archaeon]
MEQTYKKLHMDAITQSPDDATKYGLSIRFRPPFVITDLSFSSLSNTTILAEGCNVLKNENIAEDTLDLFLKDWDTHEMSKIFHLNIAKASMVSYIDIPENYTSEKEILITPDTSENSSEVFLIHAKKNSEVTVIVNKEGSQKYAADTIRVLAEDNAKVTVVMMQFMGKETSNVQHHSAKVLKDATVNWYQMHAGSEYTKNICYNNLSGVGATGNITLLYVTNGNQQFDSYTGSIHNERETMSDIVTKGAIGDTSKALSRSLVQINENAWNSNGYEQQDAILLSEKAEADAIPNLVIHNHDVKCSHGSTIGQVDEEALFYLMSRGYSKDAAKKKLIEGFFVPVLENFGSEKIVELAQNKIQQILNPTLDENVVVEVLKTIEDPEMFIDIHTLGLIYNIDIQGSTVGILMTLTTPACPFGPMIIEQVKQKLKEKGFSEVEVTITFDPIWEPSDEVRMHLGLL